MVEINNQRKAFLDMLAWSEGTDNGRQKTRNHGYDVIVGGELFTDYSDHPRKLVTLNPKLKSTGAGRYQLLSRWWDVTASSLAWKTSLRKVRTLWHCSRLAERGALPMIDRGDIRQAIDSQQYLGFTAGRWLAMSKYKAGQPDCKIQRSGRNVRRDWCMSRVTAIISALVICIIVCLSWAVNHYRDNAITHSLQRDKNARELEAGERGNYWHADASARMLLCSMQNTRRS